ncbi:unnamed protein product [Didymodactylos carnosus]|uniref:Uncharacterized protein n=1 Tax=Didymodactylos carnosus TaxID=1234261 RepID=A0A813W9D1_9BILA|nr:unnamed protein product [Didymodactylos carnosus]CAF3636628.1 unnamed protein product [Didymodactylos carnosus]
MLCYEGRRKAIKVRKERDKASRREYTGDLTNPVLYSFLPSHAILEDAELRTKLYGCSISDTMDYYFKSRSLPDLRLSDYDIKINLENEKRNVKFKRVIDELKWNNEDMDSDLDDAENLIDKRDPVQVYIKACQQFKIHPRNVVIDGLATTELNLQEMSINDVDLKAIWLGNQGALLMADVLAKNDVIQELNISNNRIDKDGAAIFASKLELNRTIKKLWFGNNHIETLGSLMLLKAVDHINSQVEYLNLENILVNDDFTDLYTQINQYLRSLTVVHGGVRGRLGRLHPGVPGFTIMDDVDLKVLDQKTLHAFFQRDPFKILGRMAKESGHDFATALKKWDEEEHGIVLYEIYVEDFPNAVAEAGITLDKTLDHILWNYLKKVSKNGSVNYL